MMSDRNSLTHHHGCMTVSLHPARLTRRLTANAVKLVTRVGTYAEIRHIWEWMQPEW